MKQSLSAATPPIKKPPRHRQGTLLASDFGVSDPGASQLALDLSGLAAANGATCTLLG